MQTLWRLQPAWANAGMRLVTGEEVTSMDNMEEKDLLIEAVELDNLEALEEVITPATGCGCGGGC
jgi:hypothetical protein